MNNQWEEVVESAQAYLPTQWGTFLMRGFESKEERGEHLVLQKGDLLGAPLIRLHSECLTGDAFGSLRCDCGIQLQASLKLIAEEGNGALIYLRNHEGRGIGLLNKIKAYALQEKGFDTVEANEHLGFRADERSYGVAVGILHALSLNRIRLITNNPVKVSVVEAHGIEVVERVALSFQPNPHNEQYLSTKKVKLGHF